MDAGTVGERVRRILAASRPIWLLWLLWILYRSVSVFADRYPRLGALVSQVRSWIS